MTYILYITAERTWCVSTTSKLLHLLEALQKTVKKSEITVDNRSEIEGSYVKSSNFTMNRDDKRLCVEVASTIKMFLFKLPYIQEYLSFRTCELSDVEREKEGSVSGNGRYDSYSNVDNMSVRPLLMRVLKPSPVVVTPSTTDECISEDHVIKLLCAQVLWLLVCNSKSLIIHNFQASNKYFTGLSEAGYCGEINQGKEYSDIVCMRNILKGLSCRFITLFN